MEKKQTDPSTIKYIHENLQNQKDTKNSSTCTCKIDKESNLTIDKACYWHGK